MKIHFNKSVYLLAGMILACTLLSVTGCGKKTAIPVLKYQVNDDNTVTITGLTDKGKNDVKVTIPSQIEGKNVISIENETFRDNQIITQVIIEDGIQKIGDNVFFNCGSLEQIDIPASVQEIGTNAVSQTGWEYKQLEQKDEIIINNILIKAEPKQNTYTIPDGVVTIGSGVFYNDQQITEVTCPDSLRKIDTFAFAGCKNLKTISISDELEKISYSAFGQCTSLKITVPDQVKIIESEAFREVPQVTYKGTAKGSPWGAQSINN